MITFKFKPGFSLLCLFLFILCCTLGTWQLHRYTQKKILLTTYQQRMGAVPQKFQVVSESKDLQFQQVKVSGYYVNALTMLVQNRFYHDVLGFEVLTPLKIAGEKKLLLVDRGWIKNKNEIKNVKAQQNISGYIKFSNEYQFILGKNILQPEHKPLVIQRVDMAEISHAVNQEFYPFVLRLNPAEPNGYVRDWTIVTVTPARHLGYAIQWFLLALVLVIAYCCFLYKS